MRTVFIFFVWVLLSHSSLFSQSRGFKYQAVARNAEHEPYVNENLQLRLSIIQLIDDTEWTLYTEEHFTQTTAIGHFSLNVGLGQPMIGNLADIDWSEGQYLLQVSMALEGEEQLTDMGRSPILAVPIALHAKTAEMVDDADADPGNEIQNLAIVDNQLLISGGNSVPLDGFKTPWRPTEEGIAYQDGKIDANIIRTAGLESRIGSLSSLLNASTLEFKPDQLLNAASFNRTGLNMTSGTFQADLAANRLLFSGLTSTELNQEELKLNNDKQKKYALLQTERLSFMEEKTSLRKLEIGIEGMAYEDSPRIFSLGERGASYTKRSSQEVSYWLPESLRFFQNGQSAVSILSKNALVLNNSPYAATLRAESLSFNSAANAESTSLFYEKGVSLKDGKKKTQVLSNFLQLDDQDDAAITQISTDGIYMTHFSRPRLQLLTNNEGRIQVFNSAGKRAVHVETKNGAGHIQLEAGNGKKTLELTSNNDRYGNGYLGMYNFDQKLRISLFTGTNTNEGQLHTWGSNNSKNVVISSASNNRSNGHIAVFDSRNIEQVSLYVDSRGWGGIAADVKNFRMAHPRQPGKEIWYASLEGPEAAAYSRGTARLKNGEVFIPFSEHFKEVINHKTLTVSLTPLSANTQGLAVIEKTQYGFKVKELMGGKGNFEFDWEVKAKRTGYENFPVIRDKDNPLGTYTNGPGKL